MAIGAAGALVKLVKLCVSALQHAEQQPLMLLPTASPVKTSRFVSTGRCQSQGLMCSL